MIGCTGRMAEHFVEGDSLIIFIVGRMHVFHFFPDSDSYSGSYFQEGGRATNHFGGLDVAPGGIGGCSGGIMGAIVGCHCSVLWLRASATTNFEGPHPEKASRKTALSFLQTLHCSLHR